MDVRRYTRGQDDMVAAWQLVRDGWSRPKILHHARSRGWRAIHDGVWATNQGPLTQRQLWIAAILTARRTFLDAHSACTCFGFYEWKGDYETVVRPGSGGPRRHGPLLVARSSTLQGETTRHHGLPIVVPERALLAIAPSLTAWQRGKAFREACRLKVTTAEQVARILRGRRGSRSLVALCDRYATIPYHRCRSDAECRALEVLHDATIPPPEVNVRVGRNGPEADLVWRGWRLIIEIDSKAFHPFPDIDDAAKTARWEAAGYTVRRIWANDVYFRPDKLVTLVNVHRCGL